MTAISETLKRLKTSISTQVPIIVDNKINSVNGLIDMLEKEKTLTIIKKYKTSYLLKVTKNITTLETLPKVKNVKTKNIDEVAKVMLSNSTGYLVLSTTKGIMSHKQAAKDKLGGIILGIVQ